ncbi:MAG: ABC transporter permease [Clostridiales bacterium]|nr:ABC transporter permease [Clostridiales bacterium]
MKNRTMISKGNKLLWEINALVTIAARDIILTVKSPGRIILGFAMPLIFMGMLGGTIQQNMLIGSGFEYGTFILVGMMVNTLFMMTTEGVTSIVQDRSDDFTQELMVSPISRYSIVIGKIIGASAVAKIQLIATIVVGLLMGIRFSIWQLLSFLTVAPLICLSAGATATMIIAFVKNERTANMVVVSIVMPQIFLSGAIIPVTHSSGILYTISRILPMTYSLDLARVAFYAGTTGYNSVVLFNPWFSMAIVIIMTVIFLVTGTYFFVRQEENK